MKSLHNFKSIISITLFFVFVGIYSVVFSSLTNKSSCPILFLSGIPCPSCGMTSAWLQIFKGNIEKAFYFNPLFYIVILVYVPFFLNILKIKFKFKNMYYIFLIIIFISVWAIRMYLYFPYEPMKFNETAIIPSLFF